MAPAQIGTMSVVVLPTSTNNASLTLRAVSAALAAQFADATAALFFTARAGDRKRPSDAKTSVLASGT
jgi:hypothetical protein